ncbi:MAG: hypothetical protein LBI04_08420 [Treponema sp.]|jgi:hypothetical protein|nr:hypothetical protein [Treponema sp.]
MKFKQTKSIVIYFLLISVGLLFSGCKKTEYVWYVHPEFERVWTNIIRNAPKPAMKIQVWEEGEIPTGPGVYITAKHRQSGETKANVYYRLSYDLEYQGAAVLALDPWMIFRKYRNPELTAARAYPETGGNGLLLIPGKEPAYVNAWIARLIQERPGEFPSDEQMWQDWEKKLFTGSRFSQGAQTYNLQEALFRLMGNQPAWFYAPLSAIRRYRDPNKAILEAVPFPEINAGSQYSLQAKLLWALPTGSEKEKKKLTAVMKWLKRPETQTIIADAIEWIPADPYGKPYDPMCMVSHRNWLTASFIYDLNE